MTTRRVKTDEERARDELALAMRKRARAQKKYDEAAAAARALEEELKLAAAVELHAASHPALQPEPADDPSLPPVHVYAEPEGSTAGPCAWSDEQDETCGLPSDAAVHL